MVAFVILLVFIVLGGMGFLLWRMQLQRKIINHLTGIVFRDVGANGNVTGSRSEHPVSTREHVTVTNGGMEFAVPAVESNHM